MRAPPPPGFVPYAPDENQAAPGVIGAPPIQEIVAPRPPQATPQAPALEAHTIASTQSIPIQNEQTIASTTKTVEGLPDILNERAAKLRDEFDKLEPVALYRKSVPAFFDSLQTIMDSRDPKKASAFNDQKLVYHYAKLMDPSSAVLGGETTAVKDLSPRSQQIYNDMMRQIDPKTGMFSQQLREQMATTLDGQMRTYNRGYLQARTVYGDLAKKSQIPDVSMVILPHEGKAYERIYNAWLGKKPETRPSAAAGITGVNKPLEVPITGYQRLPGESDAAYKKRTDELERRANLPPDISDVRGPQISKNVGALDAALRGAASVPTFGLSDKIAAAGDTLFGGGTMADNLKRQYAISDYDQAHHPWSTLAGMIGGGGLLPLGEMNTLGQVAGKGALVGGLYGAGSSRSLADVPENALTGAGAGAAVGAGLQLAGPALRAGGDLALRGTAAAARRFMRPPTPEQMDIAAAGAAERVPINASDVFPGARNTVSTLETIPGASSRIQEGITAGRDAIEARVADLGRGGTAREDMGAVVQGAGRRFLANRRTQADRLYTRAERLAGGADTPVVAQNTMQTLAGLIRDEAQVPGGTSTRGVIQRYADDFANRGGNMTLNGARRMRSELRRSLRNEANLTVDEAEAITRQVMDAVSTDIEQSLTQAGRRGAVRAYRTADRFYRQSSDEITNTTQHFLGTRDRPLSVEQTMDRMRLAAKNNSGRLRAMLGRLSPEERADYAATLVEPLGRATVGEPFSPTRFLSNIDKIPPAARRIIFGADGARSIENLITLSSAKKQTVANLNNPRSGMVTNYRVMLSSLLTGLPGGGAMLGLAAGAPGTGAALGAGTFAGGMAGARGLAGLLMNEGFTRLLLNAPNTANPRAVATHLGVLRRFALKNPEVRGFVDAIEQRWLQSANDNLERSVAASQPDEQQNSQGN